MFSSAREVIAIVLSLMLAPVFLPQQQDRQSDKRKDDEPIKLEATLVQVPVIVRGEGGMYLTDLKADDFIIYEDGVRQTIEFFGSIEEPFSVVLALDSSNSASEQLGLIKAAANAFVNNLRPQDRVMVLSFNDSVEVHCELTSDHTTLRNAIEAIKVGEFTQVYEAVYTAVWERLNEIDGRKAVILFTDGIDTASSEITYEDTLDAVVESEDVIVYPIRYSTRADVERKLESRQRTNESNSGVLVSKVDTETLHKLDGVYTRADEYLYELAENSGGKIERADTLRDLNGAFARIADELRHQYLLGYYTTKDREQDTLRRIKVDVKRQGAKVRARPGFKITREN